MPREKNRRRVLDLAKALLAHDEEAHLVGCTEAVLDRAYDPEAAADVAFEVEHGVNHMLEHARPRERTFLSDMADQQRRDVARFRKARELSGTLAHLTHGARSGLQLLAEQRLNRIDREHAEVVLRGHPCEHGFDARLGYELERHAGDAESLRAKADLLERLFAGD